MIEFSLNLEPWIVDVWHKNVLEVEYDDMVYGNVYLEDEVPGIPGNNWYKTVKFVRFDGQTFKREVDTEDQCDGYDAAYETAYDLVEENLKNLFEDLRSKITVKDSGKTKEISIGESSLYFSESESWWYELENAFGTTRQLNFKLPETDENLVDEIFGDIVKLVFFNKGHILPANR